VQINLEVVLRGERGREGGIGQSFTLLVFPPSQHGQKAGPDTGGRREKERKRGERGGVIIQIGAHHRSLRMKGREGSKQKRTGLDIGIWKRGEIITQTGDSPPRPVDKNIGGRPLD